MEHCRLSKSLVNLLHLHRRKHEIIRNFSPLEEKFLGGYGLFFRDEEKSFLFSHTDSNTHTQPRREEDDFSWCEGDCQCRETLREFLHQFVTIWVVFRHTFDFITGHQALMQDQWKLKLPRWKAAKCSTFMEQVRREWMRGKKVMKFSPSRAIARVMVLKD